jgi:hypothetical protein
MNRKRTLLVAALLLVVAGIAGLLVYHHVTSAPNPLLLLPEGDLLLYANLKPLHLVQLMKSTSVPIDPDYQDFVKQTGFQFEHDLDQIAVSQRTPGDFDTESSAIFTGRLDQGRMTGYLQKIANGSERYADKTIYSIPHEGHTVRVCILDAGTVAVTNMNSPEPMRGIIEKSRNSSLAGNGPYLLESYYRHVPFGSLGWAIYRMPAQQNASQLPGGINFDFLQNTVAVASVRYAGSVLIKAEIFAQSEAAAKQITESLSTFLSLYRSAGQSLGTKGVDKDVKDAFNSIEVHQSNDRAVITATIPAAFIEKAMSEASSGSSSSDSKH